MSFSTFRPSSSWVAEGVIEHAVRKTKRGQSKSQGIILIMTDRMETLYINMIGTSVFTF